MCDGMGRMMVTCTGADSAWGKTIAKLSQDHEDTPLQEKLSIMAGMSVNFVLFSSSFFVTLFSLILFPSCFIVYQTFVTDPSSPALFLFIYPSPHLLSSLPPLSSPSPRSPPSPSYRTNREDRSRSSYPHLPRSHSFLGH